MLKNFIATLIFIPSIAFAQNVQAPIVVELFTSQGCSSCPPADEILKELSEQDNIIALGCHVSYFNHLQWTDTFSQDFCDMRQHGYVGLTGGKRIYTPQMIVNGENGFIGSKKDKVSAALEQAKQNPIQSISAQIQDGIISFTLSETTGGSYRIWAYGYKNTAIQDIKSGENKGNSISYAAPVMSYSNLGSWNGMGITQRFEKPDIPIDGIAILAQENGYGRIVAAGKLSF